MEREHIFYYGYYFSESPFKFSKMDSNSNWYMTIIYYMLKYIVIVYLTRVNYFRVNMT